MRRKLAAPATAYASAEEVADEIGQRERRPAVAAVVLQITCLGPMRRSISSADTLFGSSVADAHAIIHIPPYSGMEVDTA